MCSYHLNITRLTNELSELNAMIYMCTNMISSCQLHCNNWTINFFHCRKSGNNLSLILTEPVFSNEIIKPKSKRKQVRENNTPPDSPVLNYSKDCPDASEESLLKTSPKRQSTLDHNSLRNDKSVDVDKSPESCQESSFTNDNSYEEQKKNIAQMQTEQCNEELSKTKSILPETLSPRSHQSIALGFYDGKSNSVKNASSSGSHLSEERKNLDKSIYNLLQWQGMMIEFYNHVCLEAILAKCCLVQYS